MIAGRPGLLYIQGKENGEMLKDLNDNGPYQFKLEITIKDTYGFTEICRPQRLEDLAGEDKLRYDSDIKADRIKELMKGTEMTKQERQSMLYDEFDRFTSKPRVSIHLYYLRFTKFINDMRMIPITMSPMQINTKFVNHLQPEWSHIAKQCTARKKVKDSEWFKDKMLLAQAQEAGVVLNEVQQDFLEDNLEETVDCEDLQLQATTNFKVDNVDAYDSDYDDEATTNAIFVPELVQETTEKISYIKDRLKAARDCQKSYADKRMKPLEFSVGDYVLLKVSPWKGVVRFGKKRKLAPRFVGTFEIIEKVGPVAYRLDLHKELDGVHDTFHVSNLKKCLADPTLQVPLDEIQVDAKLNFIEEPMEI
ncbi:hypothetical protein Tco_0517367 [Tanacetum coccineum]